MFSSLNCNKSEPLKPNILVSLDIFIPFATDKATLIDENFQDHY